MLCKKGGIGAPYGTVVRWSRGYRFKFWNQPASYRGNV